MLTGTSNGKVILFGEYAVLSGVVLEMGMEINY